MIRKLAKLIAWLVGIGIALPLLLYGIVIVINQNDAKPSKLAAEFVQVRRGRPVVADERNAYFAALGFATTRDSDPVAMGHKRVAWIDASVDAEEFDLRADPLRSSFESREREGTNADFYDSCGRSNRNCARAFSRSTVALERLLAQDAWLLRRYQSLLMYDAWSETAKVSLDAPVILLDMVVDGQKLHLARAMIAARQQDAVAVNDLLARDLRFWRMVLENADSLVAKMVAVSAIDRHFEVGNLILRALTTQSVSRATPEEWQRELSQGERSMTRSCAGDWLGFSSSMRQIAQTLRIAKTIDDGTESMSSRNSGASSLRAKVVSILANPLFQPQDSANRLAGGYATALELSIVPYNMLEDEALRASVYRRPKAPFRVTSLYNLVGQWLDQEAPPFFGEYAVRIADIEGVRRAALAANDLRGAGIQRDSVSKALQSSKWRDPYRDQPFAWDDEESVIVFRGLEPGERGTFKIVY